MRPAWAGIGRGLRHVVDLDNLHDVDAPFGPTAKPLCSGHRWVGIVTRDADLRTGILARLRCRGCLRSLRSRRIAPESVLDPFLDTIGELQ